MWLRPAKPGSADFDRLTVLHITGNVATVGATQAAGTCSYTGTREGSPVSGSCAIVFRRIQTAGAFRTLLATVVATGPITGQATILFPAVPTVDPGGFAITVIGRGSTYIGGSDDGQGI